MTANPWTDERIELLKKLVREGVSYKYISAELGAGISRNAAIGKAQRLGIAGNVSPEERQRRAHGAKRRRMKPQALADNRIKMKQRRTAEVVPLPPPKRPKRETAAPRHVTLDDLTRHICRFPYGNDIPYTYCGHDVAPGEVYCEAHCALAYPNWEQRSRRRDRRERAA